MATLKRKSIFLCLAVLIVCGLPCNGTASESSELWESHLGLGLELNSFSYTEPGVMKEDGYLMGFAGILERHTEGNLRYALSSSLVFGDLEYDGYIARPDGSKEAIEATTPNYIFNLRGICGPVLDGEKCSVSPYSGLGLRFLVDDLEDPSPVYGYIREQTYVYVPLGVECRRKLSSDWMFSGLLEYDFWLFGQNYSHSGALIDGVTLDQETGSGYRASVGLTAPRSGSSSFSVVAFYEYWDVDDSEINAGYMEPQNDSTLLGLRVSACFY